MSPCPPAAALAPHRLFAGNALPQTPGSRCGLDGHWPCTGAQGFLALVYGIFRQPEVDADAAPKEDVLWFLTLARSHDCYSYLRLTILPVLQALRGYSMHMAQDMASMLQDMVMNLCHVYTLPVYDPVDLMDMLPVACDGDGMEDLLLALGTLVKLRPALAMAFWPAGQLSGNLADLHDLEGCVHPFVTRVLDMALSYQELLLPAVDLLATIASGTVSGTKGTVSRTARLTCQLLLQREHDLINLNTICEKVLYLHSLSSETACAPLTELDLDILCSFLSLLTALLADREVGCWVLGQHPQLCSGLLGCLGLAAMGLPADLMARAVDAVTALIHSCQDPAPLPQLIRSIWEQTEALQLFTPTAAQQLMGPGTGAGGGVLLSALLGMVEGLVMYELPEDLGAGVRLPGLHPLVYFLVDHVIVRGVGSGGGAGMLNMSNQDDEDDNSRGMRWRIFAQAMAILSAMVAHYPLDAAQLSQGKYLDDFLQPSVTFTTAGGKVTAMAPKSSPFLVLACLSKSSSHLRQIAVSYLSAVSKDSGRALSGELDRFISSELSIAGDYLLNAFNPGTGTMHRGPGNGNKLFPPKTRLSMQKRMTSSVDPYSGMIQGLCAVLSLFREVCLRGNMVLTCQATRTLSANPLQIYLQSGNSSQLVPIQLGDLTELLDLTDLLGLLDHHYRGGASTCTSSVAQLVCSLWQLALPRFSTEVADQLISYLQVEVEVEHTGSGTSDLLLPLGDSALTHHRNSSVATDSSVEQGLVEVLLLCARRPIYPSTEGVQGLLAILRPSASCLSYLEAAGPVAVKLYELLYLLHRNRDRALLRHLLRAHYLTQQLSFGLHLLGRGLHRLPADSSTTAEEVLMALAWVLRAVGAVLTTEEVGVEGVMEMLLHTLGGAEGQESAEPVLIALLTAAGGPGQAQGYLLSAWCTVTRLLAMRMHLLTSSFTEVLLLPIAEAMDGLFAAHPACSEGVVAALTQMLTATQGVEEEVLAAVLRRVCVLLAKGTAVSRQLVEQLAVCATVLLTASPKEAQKERVKAIEDLPAVLNALVHCAATSSSSPPQGVLAALTSILHLLPATPSALLGLRGVDGLVYACATPSVAHMTLFAAMVPFPGLLRAIINCGGVGILLSTAQSALTTEEVQEQSMLATSWEVLGAIAAHTTLSFEDYSQISGHLSRNRVLYGILLMRGKGLSNVQAVCGGWVLLLRGKAPGVEKVVDEVMALLPECSKLLGLLGSSLSSSSGPAPQQQVLDCLLALTSLLRLLSTLHPLPLMDMDCLASVLMPLASNHPLIPAAAHVITNLLVMLASSTSMLSAANRDKVGAFLPVLHAIEPLGAQVPLVAMAIRRIQENLMQAGLAGGLLRHKMLEEDKQTRKVPRLLSLQ